MNPNEVHNRAIRIAMGLEKSDGEILWEKHLFLQSEVERLKKIVEDQKTTIVVLSSMVK
jgi:hypothetical protein